MSFFDIFQELCDENNVTANKVAIESGFNRTLPPQWKGNDVIPKAEYLIKIADYFNVSVDYLLGRTSVREVNKQKKLSSLSEEQLQESMRLVSIFSELDRETKSEVLGLLESRLRQQLAQDSEKANE